MSDAPRAPTRVGSLWTLEYLRREIEADGGKHYRETVMKGADAYQDVESRLADFDDNARQAFLKQVRPGAVLQLTHSTLQFVGKEQVRASLLKAFAIKLVGENRALALARLQALSIPDLEAVEDVEEALSKDNAKALRRLIRTVRDDPTVSILRDKVINWPDPHQRPRRANCSTCGSAMRVTLIHPASGARCSWSPSRSLRRAGAAWSTTSSIGPS